MFMNMHAMRHAPSRHCLRCPSTTAPSQRSSGTSRIHLLPEDQDVPRPVLSTRLGSQNPRMVTSLVRCLGLDLELGLLQGHQEDTTGVGSDELYDDYCVVVLAPRPLHRGDASKALSVRRFRKSSVLCFAVSIPRVDIVGRRGRRDVHVVDRNAELVDGGLWLGLRTVLGRSRARLCPARSRRRMNGRVDVWTPGCGVVLTALATTLARRQLPRKRGSQRTVLRTALRSAADARSVSEEWKGVAQMC
ncbi:hypothetical protein BD413DRAFT_527165 [Trametes elegans]|nr:hypothetical protein BD413DRAFT_527165 [Trametes elegans]